MGRLGWETPRRRVRVIFLERARRGPDAIFIRVDDFYASASPPYLNAVLGIRARKCALFYNAQIKPRAVRRAIRPFTCMYGNKNVARGPARLRRSGRCTRRLRVYTHTVCIGRCRKCRRARGKRVRATPLTRASLESNAYRSDRSRRSLKRTLKLSREEDST